MEGIPKKFQLIKSKILKKLIEQEEREVTISDENIERGQNAEVIHGPFKGMTGEVIKIYGNYRIVIRIDALGCSLEIHNLDLKFFFNNELIIN